MGPKLTTKPTTTTPNWATTDRVNVQPMTQLGFRMSMSKSATSSRIS